MEKVENEGRLGPLGVGENLTPPPKPVCWIRQWCRHDRHSRATAVTAVQPVPPTHKKKLEKETSLIRHICLLRRCWHSESKSGLKYVWQI